MPVQERIIDLRLIRGQDFSYRAPQVVDGEKGRRFAIAGVTAASKYWFIDGDVTEFFLADDEIEVAGNHSDANGQYSVASASFGGGQTVIIVVEAIDTDANAFGTITRLDDRPTFIAVSGLAQIRDEAGGTLIGEFDVVVDSAPNGQYTISMDAADTLLIAAGRYVYDVRIDNNAGTETLYPLRGAIVVVDPVSEA